MLAYLADHAVRMAKFARLSMIRMRELTSQMEVTLGPDTGDLQMRVGMHSGSVLAGVLRGEKSRFQIFGDTVNMAARMESVRCLVGHFQEFPFEISGIFNSFSISSC
jgi:class 3 adenylate cyclase